MSLSPLSACGWLGALKLRSRHARNRAATLRGVGNGARPAAGGVARFTEHRVPHRADDGPCDGLGRANGAASEADAERAVSRASACVTAPLATRAGRRH